MVQEPFRLSFTQWQAELLLALGEFDAEYPEDNVDLATLANERVPNFKSGWVRKAYGSFESRGYVKGTLFLGGGPDGGIHAKLTGLGLEEIERILDERAKQPAVGIPASDRVVRLDDNYPGRADAIIQIEQVCEGLSFTVNDSPLTAEERSVAVQEIQPFLNRLKTGWVRTGEIFQAVTKGSPLVWLMDKLGGLALGAVVSAAVAALVLMLGFLA